MSSSPYLPWCHVACLLTLPPLVTRGRYAPPPPPVGDAHGIEKKYDTAALEAVSCVVAADPGDLIVFTDSVYHRTQDILAQTRIALVAEAVHSAWSGQSLASRSLPAFDQHARRLARRIFSQEGGAAGEEFASARLEPDDFMGEEED